jgi:hypothetical protein
MSKHIFRKVVPALLSIIRLVGATGCSSSGSDGGENGVSTDPPSDLRYPEIMGSYIVDTPIVANVPSVTGVVDSFSVSPALPTGLALDGGTGAITGTPRATSGSEEYVVTATNGAGSTETTLYMTVVSTAGATIQGTLTLPSSVTDRLYVVMVDTDHNGENGGVVAATAGRMTGTTADYTVRNVPAGTYVVYAVVYAPSDTIGAPGPGDFTSGNSETITVAGTGTYPDIDRTLAAEPGIDEVLGTWYWTGEYDFSLTFGENELTFASPDSNGTISYVEVAGNRELVGRITEHPDASQIGSYHKFSWSTPETDDGDAGIMEGTDVTLIVIFEAAESAADAWDTIRILEESQQGFYTRAADPPTNDFYLLNIIVDGATGLEPGDYNIAIERDLAGGEPEVFSVPRSDVGLDANGDYQTGVPFSGRQHLSDGEDNIFSIWRDVDKDGVLDAGEYYSRVFQAWGVGWEGTNVVFDTWDTWENPPVE